MARVVRRIVDASPLILLGKAVPGGYRMRGLLILGGIGILSAAACTVIADDGASGYGSKHARPGHGGLEYHMRHGGGHCNRWATGDVFSNPTGTPSLGIGTRSRPGHAHGRLGGGQTRAYDCGSSGGSSHPPAHTRHGAGRAGRGCDSAADSSQRRRIGPGGRGDGAAESHRQPIAAASPGRRRPGSAGVRVVQPRAARTRTTAKSSTVSERNGDGANETGTQLESRTSCVPVSSLQPQQKLFSRGRSS